MTVALRDPSLVANLIPVDNAPVDAALGNDFGRYVEAMRRIEAAGVDRQAAADELLAPYEESLAIRQFLLTNLVRGEADADTGRAPLRFRIPLDVMARSLGHMADFPFRDPDTHRFEGPTLVLRGTRSRYVADDALPAVGRFFPRFEVRDVDAGHWLISENPEAFRQAVVDWLSDKR